jgi:hypothetical protein
MHPEVIPVFGQLPIASTEPRELYSLLKDTTDYAWYTTSIDLEPHDLSLRPDILPVIRVASLGHAMQVFVNGEYIGGGHGRHDEKSFVFERAVNLKPGVNQISLLCMTVGLPDSGAYMEHRFAGPRSVTLLGLNTGTLDLTMHGWQHQVGLNGEKLRVYTQAGSKKVSWNKVDGQGPALTWYKANFDAPAGNEPVAIRMTGMGKGMIWINGNSIGRHWMSFLSPLGLPTQSEYHIPRSFIKPSDNLIVVLEEESRNPNETEILLVDRDTVCSFISEQAPPHVKSWKMKDSKFKPAVDIVRPAADIKCPKNKEIVAVDFASYGDPYGVCGKFFVGKCNAPIAKEVVEKHCLGMAACSVPIEREMFFKNNDPCPDISKILAIQVRCSRKKN